MTRWMNVRFLGPGSHVICFGTEERALVHAAEEERFSPHVEARVMRYGTWWKVQTRPRQPEGVSP